MQNKHTPKVATTAFTTAALPGGSALMAVALVSALVLSACGQKEPSADAAKGASPTASASKGAGAPAGKGGPGALALSVTVAKAEMGVVPTELQVDAALTSLSSPDISAEVAGKVSQVLVKPGAQVRRGQVLAILDGQDLALSAAETQAQVAQVQAQVAERQRAATRANELYAKEYVSRASRDAAVSELDAARAQLAAIQARARLSERSLNKTKVIAPFDGTVVEVKTAPGAYARVGDTLMQMWSADNSVLTLKVPLDHLGVVKTGQDVSVLWGGNVLASKVLRVNPMVDLNSRSFDVHAEIPQQLASFGGLRMRAVINVPGEPVLSIPAQAPQLDGEKSFVVTIENGKAKKVPVTLGLQSQGKVVVTYGLKEGDEVVVEGASFANQGQSLTVASEARAASGAQASEGKGAAR